MGGLHTGLVASAVFVPDWAAPTRRQVEDLVGMCRAAGLSPRADDILAAAADAADCESADEAVAVAREHSLTGSSVLLWLAGKLPTPPLDLPRRREDGEIVATDELVAEALKEEPHRYRLPEDRAALRSKCAEQVAKWRRLDALIASAG